MKPNRFVLASLFVFAAGAALSAGIVAAMAASADAAPDGTVAQHAQAMVGSAGVLSATTLLATRLSGATA